MLYIYIAVDKVINEIEPCAFGIKLVRVGDQARIHKDIRQLSLQVLVDEAKKSNMPKGKYSTLYLLQFIKIHIRSKWL